MSCSNLSSCYHQYPSAVGDLKESLKRVVNAGLQRSVSALDQEVVRQLRREGLVGVRRDPLKNAG